MIKRDNKVQFSEIESGLILDCLDFDILIIDSKFKILFANKAFLEKVKMKSNEVIGKFCYKITHHLNSPCKPPHDSCPINNVIKTGKPSLEVHTHFKKDKSKFLVNVTAAAINKEKKEKEFLHIALPIKEKTKIKQDMKDAMDKTISVLKVVQTYQLQINDLKTKKLLLEETKKELESKVEDLEKFTSMAIGRELKMVELKKKIRELEKESFK